MKAEVYAQARKRATTSQEHFVLIELNAEVVRIRRATRARRSPSRSLAARFGVERVSHHPCSCARAASTR